MPFNKGHIPWNVGGSGKEWTSEELEFLRTHYEALGATALAEKLGRSFGSVFAKANKIRLGRGPLDTAEDIKKVEALSDTETAYLAGLLDGEGTISMKGYRRQRKQNATVYMSVSMTDEKSIGWLQDHVGGTVSSSHDGNPKHRRVYQWHSERAGHVLAILLRIRPYVVTKQPHVELAIEACRIRLSRPRSSETTQEEFVLKERIQVLQMKRKR